MKAADKEAESLMNLNDILDGPFAWPDQRGFILNDAYYIVPIVVGSISQFSFSLETSFVVSDCFLTMESCL